MLRYLILVLSTITLTALAIFNGAKPTDLLRQQPEVVAKAENTRSADSPTTNASNNTFQRIDVDLGLIVVKSIERKTVAFRVGPDQQIVQFSPASLSIGKPCCTRFHVSDDWQNKPGGEMVIAIPPIGSNSVWTARVFGEAGEYLFAASATVVPVLRFADEQGMVLAKLRPRDAKSMVSNLLLVRRSTSRSLLPVVTCSEGVECRLAACSATKTLQGEYVEDRFPLAVTLKASNAAGNRLERIRANLPGGDFACELKLSLETEADYKVEPRAIIWKQGSLHDSKQVTLRALNEHALDIVDVRATENLRVNGLRYSSDRKSATVEVQCQQTKRGNAGSVKIVGSHGETLIPAFVLGGE